jgi:hypothetical protein
VLMKSRPADPAGMVVRCVRSSLEGAGVTVPQAATTPWRGMRSAMGNGLGVSAEGKMYVAARCAWHEQSNRQVIFVAVGERMPDAVGAREALERDTQLIEK